jgi:hypothetical protein
MCKLFCFVVEFRKFCPRRRCRKWRFGWCKSGKSLSITMMHPPQLICEICDCYILFIYGLQEHKELFIASLFTLRLLGKFLGFVTFLPYQTTTKLPDEMEATYLSLRKHVSDFCTLCSDNLYWCVFWLKAVKRMILKVWCPTQEIVESNNNDM